MLTMQMYIASEHITTTAKLFNDKESLTKLIFYTNNSTRLYRNGENGVDTGLFIHNDYHYIQYGFDLTQNIKKKFSNFFETNLMVGGNAYFNLTNYSMRVFPEFLTDNLQTFYTDNIYALKTKIIIALVWRVNAKYMNLKKVCCS